MIDKVKEKFRDNPTWFGVTVGLTIILIISISTTLVSGWYVTKQAKQAAINEVNVAVGNRIDEFSKLLDRFEKLTITQTQNVNVPTVGDQVRTLADDITKKRTEKETQ